MDHKRRWIQSSAIMVMVLTLFMLYLRVQPASSEALWTTNAIYNEETHAIYVNDQVVMVSGAYPEMILISKQTGRRMKMGLGLQTEDEASDECTYSYIINPDSIIQTCLKDTSYQLTAYDLNTYSESVVTGAFPSENYDKLNMYAQNLSDLNSDLGGSSVIRLLFNGYYVIEGNQLYRDNVLLSEHYLLNYIYAIENDTVYFITDQYDLLRTDGSHEETLVADDALSIHLTKEAIYYQSRSLGQIVRLDRKNNTRDVLNMTNVVKVRDLGGKVFIADGYKVLVFEQGTLIEQFNDVIDFDCDESSVYLLDLNGAILRLDPQTMKTEVFVDGIDA